MAHDTVKEFIKDLKDEPMFSLFTDEEIDKMSPFFELINYPEKSVIFKEGESGDFIAFVVSGKLEVKKQTEFKGNQIIVALLTRGAMVGELSIFDKHYRSATVEAVEDTTLIILRNKALESILAQYPDIGIKILKGFIRVLSLRLRKATERLTTVF